MFALSCLGSFIFKSPGMQTHMTKAVSEDIREAYTTLATSIRLS